MKKKSKNMCPPKSMVMTGYMLTKAVNEGVEYLTTALQCMDEAIKDANKQLDDQIYQSEVATAKRLVYEAIAGLHKAKEAHEILRKGTLERGFREITNADFSEFGAGGNR